MNGLKHSPQDAEKIRSRIESEVAAASGERSNILRSIHEVVYDLNLHDDVKITRTMARLATLLAALAEQADTSTRENIAVQRKLTELTVRIFWLTVAVLLVALLQLIFMALK